MNILFLTIAQFNSIEDHSIYADLLRCFRNNNHEVYVVSPNEKRFGKGKELINESGAHILHVATGDVTGASNLIKKGVAQIAIETRFIKAIDRYFCDVKFDLVLYSTPPITFCKVVEFVKKRDDAKSYLLLKDIFPQNAVDIGMLSNRGPKGIIYKFFRRKEKRLYSVSDTIGCMSQANVDYVLKHNPEIAHEKVEICPNCIEVVDKSVDEIERIAIRKRYDIPTNKTVFVYGGNLGKPQGIPFLIRCLKACKDLKDVFFIVVGDGTEYDLLDSFVNRSKQENVKLLKRIPKEDYDRMVSACDVGLIFLDHRFTIPNFPSRLLSYMQAKLPVLAATDPNSDIGKVIIEGGFGWWCESNDINGFLNTVSEIIKEDFHEMGLKGWQFEKEHYSAERGYEIICKY